MATYRQVFISFWQDSYILDLDAEGKLLYIYLLTNTKTTQCGIYELPIKVIQFETGLDKKVIEQYLKKFEADKKILYSKETSEVFMLNWLKYNNIVSPKVIACIKKELMQVKNKEYVALFIQIAEKFGYPTDELKSLLDTLSIPYPYPIDTVSIPYGEEKEEEKEKEKEEEINICSSADADVCVSIPAEKPSDTMEDGGAQSSVKKTGKDGYTLEFEEFWKHYPRKVEKKRAFRVWKARLREGVKPETLIQACKNYAVYCTRQGIEQRYIKHASTFLGPDKPYEEYINGIPADTKARAEPKSWDVLRQLYREYEEQERGDEP